MNARKGYSYCLESYFDGSVIGIILTAASAPSLIEIGGRAAKAAVSGQGLKIGVHADYPPVYADYC